VCLNAKALDAFRGDFRKLLSILIVGEESPSLIAAASRMAPGAKILDAQGTGHEGMLVSKRRGVK
jgi:hypothetical protein